MCSKQPVEQFTMLKVPTAIFLVITILSRPSLANRKMLNEAVLGSIECLKEKNSMNINIVKSVDQKFKRQADELISFLISNESATFTIQDLSRIPPMKEMKNSANIILIDSLQSFAKLYKNINGGNFNLNKFYLVVNLNKRDDDAMKIFELLWLVYVYNVNIIYEVTQGKILMKTFLPFDGQHCNNLTPITINTFDENSLRWKRLVDFPAKLSNLHKCPIRIGAFENLPDLKVLRTKVGSAQLQGFAGEFFEELSKLLNFSMDVHSETNIGYLYENETATGMMKKLLDGDLEIILSLLSLQPLRVKFFTPTAYYYFDKIVILVPPQAELSPFMKLLHPFTINAWISILSIVFISYCVIFIMKLLPKKISATLVGDDNRNPFLNVLIALIGSSQHKLPKGNFARLLLMTFLIFTLILRSMYTGKLFYVMKSSIYSKEMTTIDEFYDANFDFYMHHGMAQKFKELKFYKP